MPRFEMIRYLLLVLLFTFAACAHTAVIKTVPEGATVTIDGKVLGQSPVAFKEKTGLNENYDLRIEKEGYRTFEKRLTQREINWLIAGPSTGCAVLGCLPALVGWAFSFQLRDSYTFELEPATP